MKAGGPPPPAKKAAPAGLILLPAKHGLPMKAAGFPGGGPLPGGGQGLFQGGGLPGAVGAKAPAVQGVGPQYRHMIYALGNTLATYGLAPPAPDSDASLARGGPYNRLNASHKIILATQAACNRAAQAHLHVSPPLDGQLQALARRRTTNADLELIAQGARDNHLSPCLAQLCHSGGQWLEHSDSVAHLEGIQTVDGLRVVHRHSRYGQLPAMSRVWMTDALLDVIAADSDTFVGLVAPENIPVDTSDDDA
jgi:hypothetical protein